MKKFFTIIVFATIMTSCNNDGTATTESANDSTTMSSDAIADSIKASNMMDSTSNPTDGIEKK